MSMTSFSIFTFKWFIAAIAIGRRALPQDRWIRFFSWSIPVWNVCRLFFPVGIPMSAQENSVQTNDLFRNSGVMEGSDDCGTGTWRRSSTGSAARRAAGLGCTIPTTIATEAGRNKEKGKSRLLSAAYLASSSHSAPSTYSSLPRMKKWRWSSRR